MVERVRFGWERLEPLLAEPNMREMLTSYWEELSPIPHLGLDIDWPRILDWERQFLFRVWVARVNGTAAGFITFLIQPHFLHKGTLIGVDHGHYLAPAFRNNGMIGMRMWRSAEKALKDLDVKICFIHDNALRPLSPFFLAIGARPFSSMWLLDFTER